MARELVPPERTAFTELRAASRANRGHFEPSVVYGAASQPRGRNAMRDQRIWWIVGAVVIVLVVIWVFWPGAEVPVTPTTPPATTQ